MSWTEDTTEGMLFEPFSHSQVERFEIDRTDDPSTAIVRAVAEVTGRNVAELPPLYEATDPDAVDGLFRRSEDGTAWTDCILSFSYADSVVRVTGSEVRVARV